MCRLKLEDAMRGKRRWTDYLVPSVLSALAFAGIIILPFGSKSFDMSSVTVPLLLIFALNAWHMLESATLKAQVEAIREYFDLRITEITELEKKNK
jgi:hypothetical protein